MAEDITLDEEDIKRLAQRGGMGLGEQQVFWETWQDFLSGAASAFNVSTVMTSRPLGVPFRLSLTNHVLVTYTTSLVINAGADDAGMFLISDESPNPTTVRCKSSIFNTAIGAGAAYASHRGSLNYLVPPGHYVMLQPNIVGTGQAGLDYGVEQEYVFGTETIVVPQDGPDNWYLPESNDQFEALGLDTPDALWLMQDADTHAADEHGACKLTAAGTVSYGNAVTGWTRTFLGTTDGSAGTFTTSSSTLPNPASESMGVFALINVATPSATRSLLQFAANDLRARVTTGPLLQLLVDDGSTQNGVSDPTSDVRAVYMQYDFTNSTAKLYTDQEIITATYAVAASRNVIFGDGVAAATARYGYGFALYGAKAEKSDAEVRTMFAALGITTAW